MKTIEKPFKFHNMRKPQGFIIYPCMKTDNSVILQSDKRIIRVDLQTQQATLSTKGPYNTDLLPERGSVNLVLNKETIEQIILMRDQMATPDGKVTLIG